MCLEEHQLVEVTYQQEVQETDIVLFGLCHSHVGWEVRVADIQVVAASTDSIAAVRETRSLMDTAVESHTNKVSLSSTN